MMKIICYRKYACPDSYCTRYPKGIHVLVCEAHKMKQCVLSSWKIIKRI